MKADLMFIDEANTIPTGVLERLTNRSTLKIFSTFNPKKPFMQKQIITDIQQLRQLRKNKSISLKTLEAETGISKKDLFDIELEQNNVPNEKIEKYIASVNQQLNKK